MLVTFRWCCMKNRCESEVEVAAVSWTLQIITGSMIEVKTPESINGTILSKPTQVESCSVV